VLPTCPGVPGQPPVIGDQCAATDRGRATRRRRTPAAPASTIANAPTPAAAPMPAEPQSAGRRIGHTRHARHGMERQVLAPGARPIVALLRRLWYRAALRVIANAVPTPESMTRAHPAPSSSSHCASAPTATTRSTAPSSTSFGSGRRGGRREGAPATHVAPKQRGSLPRRRSAALSSPAAAPPRLEQADGGTRTPDPIITSASDVSMVGVSGDQFAVNSEVLGAGRDGAGQAKRPKNAPSWAACLRIGWC
jgi:hypothetical protein